MTIVDADCRDVRSYGIAKSESQRNKKMKKKKSQKPKAKNQKPKTKEVGSRKGIRK
jgi:hypothetical protein